MNDFCALLNYKQWYYIGSDDNQEICFADIEKRLIKVVFVTGTAFFDGAFWVNNDCFIMAKYYINDNYFRFLVYDLTKGRREVYRYKASDPVGYYLEYDMKTGGVIIRE